MRQGSSFVLANLITNASPMAGLPEEQDAARAREQAWERRGQSWRERSRPSRDGAN